MPKLFQHIFKSIIKQAKIQNNKYCAKFQISCIPKSHKMPPFVNFGKILSFSFKMVGLLFFFVATNVNHILCNIQCFKNCNRSLYFVSLKCYFSHWCMHTFQGLRAEQRSHNAKSQKIFSTVRLKFSTQDLELNPECFALSPRASATVLPVRTVNESTYPLLSQAQANAASGRVEVRVK